MGAATDLIGQVLNDTYRIERLIGEGGMGAVYEASHLRLARCFAVKLLSSGIAESPEATARFGREGQIIGPCVFFDDHDEHAFRSSDRGGERGNREAVLGFRRRR